MKLPRPEDLIKNVFAGIIVLLLFSYSSAARAGEYLWAPDDCEFQMTFPGEPHAIRRCHNKMPDKCMEMTGYTEVFELDATVNIYVSCNPSEISLRKDFTPDLLRTTLLARPNADLLEVYDISQSDTPDALIGALFGAGESPNGNDQMVYIAQLWVGNSSLLTLEAELIGTQSDDVDKAFANILATLKPKNEHPVTPEAPAKEEKPAAETPPPAEEKSQNQ